ncbi:MAG: permease, partial [Variovorax sp.]
MAGALLLIMWQSLLPGLLCVCIGFLATRRIARLLDAGLRRSRWAQRDTTLLAAGSSLPHIVSATIVMLAPLGLAMLAFSEARDFVLSAPQQ